MKKYEKLLRKISKEDRERIVLVVGLIKIGKLDLLKVEKLVGFDTFKVRVGKFRIKFKIFKSHNEILSIEKRSDNTYNNLFLF